MDVDSALTAAMRRRQRTAQAVPSPRTPEHRYGPGREVAPHLKGVRGLPGPGRRGARRTTRYDDRGPLLPSRSSSSCTMKSPAVPGRPVWSRRRGLRRRFSGTPWSSSPTSLLWCRSWTLLGCWGRLGWWTSFGSSTRRRWTSWSSPCPSSISPGFLNAARVVDRGEQNSWWRYRRSYPTLLTAADCQAAHRHSSSS